MKKNISFVAEVQCPKIPNFIKLDGAYRSLADFTNEQLYLIAEMWTSELLTSAQKKREWRERESK